MPRVEIEAQITALQPGRRLNEGTRISPLEYTLARASRLIRVPTAAFSAAAPRRKPIKQISRPNLSAGDPRSALPHSSN